MKNKLEILTQIDILDEILDKSKGAKWARVAGAIDALDWVIDMNPEVPLHWEKRRK